MLQKVAAAPVHCSHDITAVVTVVIIVAAADISPRKEDGGG
jgi:hypothetical protein